ncbi:MAG: TVP38/TMEM64 family protein [Bacilli bacterium]|nr:TVP38/TMEM64 family protein [Bacilli bacterium]
MQNLEVILGQVVNYMISFGPLGGFVLVMIESFIPILPLGIIVGLNMLSFGNVFGFLLSYVATSTGCMLVFWFIRYFVKDKYINWFNDKNQVKIKKWMGKLSHMKFTTIAVLFALPITPSFFVNIAGGLSDISVKKYMTALLVGKPAMLLFYGYIAVSLADSFKDPRNLIKVVILVTITYIISKVIEKIVKVDV